MKHIVTVAALLLLAVPAQAQRYLGDVCPNGQTKPSQAAINAGTLNCADLMLAKLPNANLQGADLAFSRLQAADLSGANLKGASLRGADLRDTDFTGADLTNADLTGAYYSSGTKLPTDFSLTGMLYCWDEDCEEPAE